MVLKSLVPTVLDVIGDELVEGLESEKIGL